MRTAMFAVGVALVTMVMVSAADARPRVTRARRFESNKTFGVGLELGAPTGLTGKYFLGDQSDRALDFGIGYLGNYLDDRNGLHIYADYLWHPVVLAHTDAFDLPLYLGAGLRYWNFDYGPDAGFAIGIRVPFGLAMDFNNIPLDVFLSLVPVLDFLHDYVHGIDGDFDVSIGARFWFE
jgi:opacity protein-like surface antigen